MYVETVIIGGGSCGVNLALWLKEKEHDYLLLEKNDLLGAWKHDRWNAFQLNTPNCCNLLHGQQLAEMDEWSVGKGFDKQLQLWQDYIAKSNLSYKEHNKVSAVTRLSNSTEPNARFSIQIEPQDDSPYTIACRDVVCCSGENHLPKTPSIAAKVPPSIKQMHSKDFKCPEQFPDHDKAILVVGSGQSGIQIADHLLDAGKKVWLCTSKVPAIFRSYRGKDTFYWLECMGMTGMTNEVRKTMPNAEQMRYGRKPIVGSSSSLSYFSVAGKGATILGSLNDIQDGKLIMKENRLENVKIALGAYQKYSDSVKAWVAKQPEEVQAALPAETPESGLPELEWKCLDDELLESNGPNELNLQCCQGVIWATGYRSAISSYLKIPEALETDMNAKTGSPDVMVSESVPGLFYSGFPWTHGMLSDIIKGFEMDHEILSALIVNQETQETKRT